MIRLAIRVPAARAEEVLGALLELAPSGVEQRDGDGFVEYAVYGAPGELPTLPRGEAVIGGVPVQVGAEEVPDDWAERWKRFHGPILLDGRLYLRPPWEPAAVRPGVVEVVIDPGRAFGTGSHPTTRMCLELMLTLDRRGSLADLGCGSGVLAIAGTKLGFRPVVAVDADGAAVETTVANARANAARLDHVDRVDLRRSPPPMADVITANLMRPLLLRVAGLLAEAPRVLIVSGLLEEEADEVGAAFSPLVERRRLTTQGWSALLLERG